MPTTLKMREIHTVPVWEEDGLPRVPDEDEIRDDLPVVGWANVLLIDVSGERRRFLAVYEGWD